MSRRDIVNSLFIVSFPVYGIGCYISAISSPSAGYIVSLSPHLLIVVFYWIDLLYWGDFNIRLNKFYWLMMIFVLSTVGSLFVALFNGLPESNLIQTLTRSSLLLIPFHAFVIIVLYNDRKDNLLKLTLISLSVLLAINLVGYFGLGMSNGIHSIEGRLNFPFLDGFYSGASLIAIINILLLYYLRLTWRNPLWFSALGAYFFLNMVMLLMINSRLTILVFVLVVGFMLFGAIRMRGLYTVSMFTLPILLGSGALIYKVLQLPGLSSLLQRVDVEDVTTFNGRAFIWRDVVDWLSYDRQGLLWGNGYKGHYFLGLISDVAKLWNEKDLHHMHLHSTSSEILVSQGIIFFVLFAFLFYSIYAYYRKRHKGGQTDGAFFPVIVFLLFIMQVDTFLYLDNLGSVIFSLLVAMIAVKRNSDIRLDIQQSPHWSYRELVPAISTSSLK